MGRKEAEARRQLMAERFKKPDRVVQVPDANSFEQVTALLYVLINEHLPAKDILEAIRKARGLIGVNPYYADPRLEAWARELALKVLR